jgi:hypothetical protein
LAFVVSLTLGVSARRQAAPLAAEARRLQAANQELTSFRSSFRPSAPDDESLRIPDSLAIGISRDTRVSLAQQVAQRAEQSGLRDVRVRFAGPDSATAPAAPAFTGNSVTIADYTLAIECSGGFAAMMSLVNHLPPSVALQRITAVRSSSGTAQFHLVLAVFETAGPNQHG